MRVCMCLSARVCVRGVVHACVCVSGSYPVPSDPRATETRGCVCACVCLRAARGCVCHLCVNGSWPISSSRLLIAVTGFCFTERGSTLGSTRKLDAAGGGSGGPGRGTGTDVVVPGRPLPQPCHLPRHRARRIMLVTLQVGT